MTQCESRGDRVCDTPASAAARTSGGCPGPTGHLPTAAGNDPDNNFMSYVTDRA